MVEPTIADLRTLPSRYNSARALFDLILEGDTAYALIEACSSGDASTVRDLLEQPEWISKSMDKPHFIYSVDRPSTGPGDLRGVLAMPLRNLERAIIKAAVNGHAEVVSDLLHFAGQRGIKRNDALTYWAVEHTIRNGHVDVIEAMVRGNPAFHDFHLYHGTKPLDSAVKGRKTEIVALLLRHGAFRPPQVRYLLSQGYGGSHLCKGNIQMTKLFLEQGLPIAGSGALHDAAEWGKIEKLRLLLEYGADVNEILPPERLTRHRGSLLATWTPLHFAASRGMKQAMQILEENGARTDGKDLNGKTPAELLEDHTQSKR